MAKCGNCERGIGKVFKDNRVDWCTPFGVIFGTGVYYGGAGLPIRPAPILKPVSVYTTLIEATRVYFVVDSFGDWDSDEEAG